MAHHNQHTLPALSLVKDSKDFLFFDIHQHFLTAVTVPVVFAAFGMMLR